jgi:membrane dipeptidase
VAGEDETLARATELARTIIITDGHIDVPYRLNKHWEDISTRTEKGEFDYERAKEGGLDAPFMSIYTPAEAEKQGRSKALADSLIDMVDGVVRDHPDKFALAVSPADVERNFANGVMSLCMGMENGSPIAGSMDNLKHFYDRGIRYITLAHSKDNHLSDSSYDTTGTNGGLTDFGREVVHEMNRLGIMVDVSHVDDDAFWQIMDITTAPVIASHSSCRYFLPGFERNISDEMIERVAENGGVIQVNFGSSFVSQEAREWGDAYRKVRDPWMKEHGYKWGDPEVKAFLEEYRKEHPYPWATVSTVADHIDHIVEIGGIGSVGFGSDFDGVGDSLPIGLKDVSQYPDLIAELMRRGYPDADIEKIAWGNVKRVWTEVERVAAASGTSSAGR